jgi:S-DNA-T family DNA segregation ATPase FtsK/SpoIIIE
LKASKQQKEEMRFEFLSIGLVVAGILGLISVLSPSTGIVNEFIDRVLKVTVGKGRYLFPVLLVLAGIRLLHRQSYHRLSLVMYGTAGLFIVMLTFFHLLLPAGDSFQTGMAGDGGGVIGASLSYLLRRSFGVAGAYIILVAGGLVALLFLTNLSLAGLITSLSKKIKVIILGVGRWLGDFLFVEVEEEEEKSVVQKPLIVDRGGGQFSVLEKTVRPDGQAKPEKVETGRPVPVEEEVIHVSGGGGQSREEETPSNGRSLLAFPYHLPPLTILARPLRTRGGGLSKDINENVRILEDTLESFGVKARVTHISRGPAITRYEIQPPAGVKVSRIVSLADDIALSMAAPDVRIEAPIPGKAAVGIEVPNKEISMVHLRDLLETREFVQSTSRLTVSLGKDIAGNPVVADLARMPHLLIAGATGSGKSVCVNTLIVSILFKSRPDEVKFLMIDPKMVELATYNGIPHLVAPVVTVPKKAATVLRWAVREMEQRYELFAAAGVRDITRYNQLCKTKGDDLGYSVLPLIVVIIDELADLMMVSPVEVEDAICRLAQMARAAGIHLVVATQRPSVDVITGLIKANIPSRISFAVSSQIDSRTILDMAGAEKLLGKGDMLFFPVGASKPMRVQGAYLSDREVDNLVSYLKKQAEPVYDNQVLKEEPKEDNVPVEIEDSLLPQAVQILIESGHASISMLQRRLHIGYARAARLIDIMEKRGIVGGYEGSKPRAILMTMEQFDQVFRKM